MKAFLIVSLVLETINLALRVGYLSENTYPRIRENAWQKSWGEMKNDLS